MQKIGTIIHEMGLRDCGGHWLHYAPSLEWRSTYEKNLSAIFKDVPPAIEQFCRTHELYPVRSQLNNVWYWRVIWRGAVEEAKQVAEDAGFDGVQTVVCGALLLFLQPVSARDKVHNEKPDATPRITCSRCGSKEIIDLAMLGPCTIPGYEYPIEVNGQTEHWKTYTCPNCKRTSFVDVNEI